MQQDNFNNKGYFMHKCHIYHTPNKEGQLIDHIPDTAQFTPFSQTNDGPMNYKAKTFKLMKQLAEAEVSNKKSYTHIRQLQKQIERYQQDIQNVMKHFGVNSISQVLKMGKGSMPNERKEDVKNDEWSNIVEEYKKIINAQQYKYVKLEQQLKLSEMKLKKQVQESHNQSTDKSINVEKLKTLEGQFLRVKEVVIVKEGEIKSLAEELEVIKKEYKQVLVDREQWKEKYAEVQNKYNMQIEHFEQMEKHVEQRLLQVERQMNYYKQERQHHLDKIERMKQQMQINQRKPYFSFGGVKHEYIQTDHDEQGSPFNQQCLQISIKTLLEQNAKLKQTLLALYNKNPEDELPKEVQLQLKILLNMHDHATKQQKQKESGEKNLRKVSEREQLEESSNALSEVKDVSEELKEEDITDRSTQQTEMMQHKD